MNEKGMLLKYYDAADERGKKNILDYAAHESAYGNAHTSPDFAPTIDSDALGEELCHEREKA